MNSPIIISINCIALKKNEIFYIENFKPFGVILFTKNIKSIIQVKNLIKNIKLLSKFTLIFVDQESGIVDRFKFFKNLNFLDNYEYYKIYLENKKLAKTLIFLKSYITSYYLSSWGFNSNTVPVLDLPINKTAKFITKRTFGSNLKVVKKLNEIIVVNNINFGLIPIIKHIPGHGVSSKDSHIVIPSTNMTLSQLAPHFNSFKAFNYLPFAMTSHIKYKNVDKNFIATFSNSVINKIIRNKINFQGLLITDDLSMKAVKYNDKEICDLSNNLDLDILLDCSCDINKYIYFSNNFNSTNRYLSFVRNKKYWLNKKPFFKKININEYSYIYDNILKNYGI